MRHRPSNVGVSYHLCPIVRACRFRTAGDPAQPVEQGNLVTAFKGHGAHHPFAFSGDFTHCHLSAIVRVSRRVKSPRSFCRNGLCSSQHHCCSISLLRLSLLRTTYSDQSRPSIPAGAHSRTSSALRSDQSLSSSISEDTKASVQHTVAFQTPPLDDPPHLHATNSGRDGASCGFSPSCLGGRRVRQIRLPRSLLVSLRRC